MFMTLLGGVLSLFPSCFFSGVLVQQRVRAVFTSIRNRADQVNDLQTAVLVMFI